MKFDLTVPLMDLRDGSPFLISSPVFGEFQTDSSGSFLYKDGKRIPKFEDKILTLQIAAGEGLSQWGQSENLSITAKRFRGKLVERIFQCPEACELSASDEALIIDRIGLIYGPLVLIEVEAQLEKQKGNSNGKEKSENTTT